VDLEISYAAQDYTDVADKNDVRVGQTATTEYAIHQFKDYATGSNITLEWEGQSNLAPSTATVYLQIYNRITSTWTEVDKDELTGADTDFVLTADIPDITNYKDGNSIISCRVYQLGT